MTWLIILFSVISGILIVIYSYCKSAFTYWKVRGVKFLAPEVPWGNLKKNGKFLTLKSMLDELYLLKDESVPFVGGYFFTKPIIVPTDLDFVKDVLIADFNYFQDRGAYSNERDDPLSAHLFSLDGVKWKALRARMTATFTSSKMKFMFPTILEVAARLSTAMDFAVKTTDSLEVRELLGCYFTDVIGSCIFGLECNSLGNPDAEFRKIGRAIFDDPRLPPLMRAFTTIFPDLARRFHIKVNQDYITEFFMGTVRETIAHRERNEIRRNDFMDILIQLKNADNEEKLSFEEIVAQAFLFFFAGFESSAATMAFAMHELMANNEVQEKARKDIWNALEKHDKELSYEALNEMKYLDQVISETLRKYPPVIFLIRKAVDDYKVPQTNLVIEKGTNLFIPTQCFQHDPEIYPQPDVFNPDRFSPEAVKHRHSQAFLSFGDGPRNCIGLRFGHLQVKIGLVELLRHFKFSKCDKTRMPIEFSKVTPVLTPKDGIWLGVERIMKEK